MIETLKQALTEINQPDVTTAQVTGHVARLVGYLIDKPAMASAESMHGSGLTQRQSFRRSYLNPALEPGWVKMTAAQSPRSPAQTYGLAARGAALAQTL